MKLVIKYTNSAYKQFVDTGDYTFQDFFISIKFNQAKQSVVPILETD